MSALFRSRWMELIGETAGCGTDKTDKSSSRERPRPPFVSSVSAAPGRPDGCVSPSDPSPSDLLRLSGNLAAEISAHLKSCRTCRMEHFTTDNPAPLCRAGLELRRRYREMRRAALAAWEGAA